MHKLKKKKIVYEKHQIISIGVKFQDFPVRDFSITHRLTTSIN